MSPVLDKGAQGQRSQSSGENHGRSATVLSSPLSRAPFRAKGRDSLTASQVGLPGACTRSTAQSYEPTVTPRLPECTQARKSECLQPPLQLSSSDSRFLNLCDWASESRAGLAPGYLSLSLSPLPPLPSPPLPFTHTHSHPSLFLIWGGTVENELQGHLAPPFVE